MKNLKDFITSKKAKDGTLTVEIELEKLNDKGTNLLTFRWNDVIMALEKDYNIICCAEGDYISNNKEKFRKAVFIFELKQPRKKISKKIKTKPLIDYSTIKEV